ncbi:MAG: hypothetical protein QNJ54_16580 [Prochloraceae cyanobacterium]|nr:hypothetical protein [Prochloraceae cyanobacterium]
MNYPLNIQLQMSFLWLILIDLEAVLSAHLESNEIELNQLKQSYQDQLLKAGLEETRASQAAQNLSQEELKLISNISPQWADIFYQIEREILAIGTGL